MKFLKTDGLALFVFGDIIFLMNKKQLSIFIIILVVLILAGAAGFYLWNKTIQEKQLIIQQQKLEIQNYKNLALIGAISSGNFYEMQELVNAGADVNAKSSLYDLPALIYASFLGRSSIVNELIKNGADINTKDINGKTALMWASLNGGTSDGIDTRYASENANIYTIENLINAGADVNEKDNNGYTALMNALFYQNINIVKKLISAGADVNTIAFNESVLSWAIKNNIQPKIIQILKDAGAKE